jgi:hypothetical protein
VRYDRIITFNLNRKIQEKDPRFAIKGSKAGHSSWSKIEKIHHSMEEIDSRQLNNEFHSKEGTVEFSVRIIPSFTKEVSIHQYLQFQKRTISRN